MIHHKPLQKFIASLLSIAMILGLTLSLSAAYPEHYQAAISEVLPLSLLELSDVDVYDGDGDYYIMYSQPVNEMSNYANLYTSEARTQEIIYDSSNYDEDEAYVYFCAGAAGTYTFDFSLVGTSYDGTEASIYRTITVEVSGGTSEAPGRCGCVPLGESERGRPRNTRCHRLWVYRL